MNECDFATTNAEKFIERLQTELIYLDTVRTISLTNKSIGNFKRISYYKLTAWKGPRNMLDFRR